MLKKQIPNLFTLLNLLSGIIAIMVALSDKLVEAAFFVFLTFSSIYNVKIINKY